ncbi:MAG: Lrp/AsnC family transcriptional regulator [Litorivicinaceae bacterium]|nr:Lrp/AsnC family transcriptional regulator [Pseudomonadota bacterium]|tara:strand:+ start:2064 stop:2519 length:456 start_codon:yes stop_codon:yes gene_type:complete
MIDGIDAKILKALQRDGRLSQLELADEVGLSPTPCTRRVKKLEADGYIRGYTALIDEERLGFGFSIFVSVRLDKQIDDRLVTFERAVACYQEVVDCWLMTGGFDYLLRVAVADLHEFERFLTRKLTKIEGVASIESSIPLRRVKESVARLV